MAPDIRKIARAVLSERGLDPDQPIRVGCSDKWVPYWTLEIEYVERLRIALRMLAEADGGKPESQRTPPAAARLSDLLEKHPDLSAYKFPASAGDIAELGKKLDEIAASLKELNGLLARFVANRSA